MAVPAAEIRAFLICDVRGYTRYTVEHGDEAAARLAAAFAEVVESAVAEFGGDVLELRGDEALVVFTSARQAVRAAVELQRAAARLPLGVGAGIDAGEAVPVLGGYRGQALNLAARLCSLAAPGEVLASDSLTHLAGRVAEVHFDPRGSVQLKGFAEPVDVVAIEPEAPPVATAAAAGPPAEERIPIGAYLGSLPAGPLVGRTAEWDQVRAVLEEVELGAGRTLMLAGEPGAGKTRLAQEAMLLLRDRGYAIAAGSCLETRQAVPYFPFLDVLPRLVAAYERAGLGGLERWPYLGRLLAGGGGSDVAEAEEERVRRDVAGFVARLSRARPVAILIDDLHWADASTLELLHQLARQLRTEAVVTIATYRDVEVRHDHPLERLIRALRRDELATVVGVRRLDAGGTAALVAASFGEESVSIEFSELIHAQTDGNPFFVQQVLRALVERGDVYREAGAWERREVSEIDVPDSIRAAIGERVARLPEASQAALTAAAVLGQRFDFNEVAELSGLGEDQLEAALESAADGGLVRSERGESFAFDHALAQQTLLQELPARRRRRLHAQAGAVVAARAERDPVRAAEVAYHLVEADEPAEAARWSLRAAQHAEQLVALAEAEAHYRQAAELAEEAGLTDLALEAREHQGLVTGRLGHDAEAIEILSKVLDAMRTAPADDQARIAAAVGRSMMTANRAREVWSRLEPFLELPGLSDRARAAVLNVMARGAFGVADMDRLKQAATGGRDAARRAGDRGLEAEALGRLALAIELTESTEGACELFREALAIAGDDISLDVLGTIHNNYAWALFASGDFDGNARHRRICAELGERFASPGPLAFGRVMVGQAEFYRGRLDEARRWIEAAKAMLAEADVGWHSAYVWGQDGMLRFQTGDFAAAESAYRAALAAARERGDRQLSSWMSNELVVLLTETGRAEEAVAEAERELEVPSAWAYRAWQGMAQAEVDLGRFEAAIEHAQTSMAGAAGRLSRAEAVDAAVTLGAAQAGAGLRVEARATLEGAIAEAQSMPYPVQVALARTWLARLAALEGDSAGVERELSEARRLVAEHGFTFLLRRIDRPDLFAIAPVAR